jgi:hypothetical protein
MRAQSKRVRLQTEHEETHSEHPLKVLFFEYPDGLWAAQCLEYDIAAQASRLEDLYYEMERVLVSYLSLADELGQEPFKGLPKAPKKYWDIFKKSMLRVDRPTKTAHPIRTEARVAPTKNAA